MTIVILANQSGSIAEVLAQANQFLPPLESEILLCFVLKESRSYLHTWPEKKITEKAHREFSLLIEKRRQQTPIAYLTGEREFWSLPLIVTKDTLIPRPETELLVETALDLYSSKENVCVADLGTGTGAIALALAHEQPHWEIIATDKSAAALQVAKENALLHHLTNIHFHQGDWFHALPSIKFDIIISNPPYISIDEKSQCITPLHYEPEYALYAGKDGLNAIRILISGAKHYLKPNGWLLLEHGYQQGERIKSLFIKHHYTQCQLLSDLAGLPRATLGRFNY